MSGSILVWALVISVIATILCPVIAGEHAIRTYSHYKQLWYMPVWFVLIAVWVWLAVQVKHDPSLAWFRGQELNEFGSPTGSQWFPIVNALGAFLAISAIGGWVVPISKYRTEE